MKVVIRKNPAPKRYKTRRFTLRPWHYSWADRLRDRVFNPPESTERRFSPRQIRIFWSQSFQQVPSRRRR